MTRREELIEYLKTFKLGKLEEELTLERFTVRVELEVDGKVLPFMVWVNIQDSDISGYMDDAYQLIKSNINLFISGKIKVDLAYGQAWMENIINGKADKMGEFVPSVRQVLDKLQS